MAYVRDDMLGAFFIIVGTTFGFLAFMKMQRGEMNKSLNKEENDL
jgi:hypothetical protein